MDTKRLIAMMMLSFAVIFGWQLFVANLYERHPEWKRPGQQHAATQPSTDPAATQPVAGATTQTVMSAAPTTASAAPGETASTAPAQGGLRVVAAATQPTVVTLGEGDAKTFPLLVKISTAGAGLDSVTLKGFKGPDRKSDYVFQRPIDPADAFTRPMATRAITVNGTPVALGGQNWIVEKQDARSATFMLDVGQVRVRKIFELSDANAPGKGYELSVRHSVENTTQQPVKVKLGWTGPVTPPRQHPTGPDIQVIGGHDDGYERASVTHHMIESFDGKHPVVTLTKDDDGSPLLWSGTASVYFTAIERPEPLNASGHSANYLTDVLASVHKIDPDYLHRHVVLSSATTELEVPAAGGTPLTLTSNVFLGPRWRQLLVTPYYEQFPRDYDNSLVLTSGPCAWCTFNWLINGLVWLLGVFHFIARDWGLAIILLVVLVRSLLHPITKKSQISMMRMGKLGPEMERLKKKYGEDKDELNRQMMSLYKDQGIGAYLGCLPMFLQMPIWIALWSALNTTFELRQAPFLYGLTWIDDLAAPDRLIAFNNVFIPSWIPLFGGSAITGLNLLPLLLAVVFYLQQEFTPKPPAQTPEQETQMKMMKWMSLLFPVFLYNGPSGLNIYIFTSTTIGIIESKRIRDHIKQKEAEESAGKIIVDAGITKRRGDDEGGGGSSDGAKKKPTPGKPKGGLGRWLEQIQQKAEEIRREAEKGRK